MNINGINVFDYLSANPLRELNRLLVKMIFQDKRLVEAIRWRLAYAFVGGVFHYSNDLKLVLQDMHIDSLIRTIYMSIYDHKHFFILAKERCKVHFDLGYVRKEYDLYLTTISEKNFEKSIERYKLSLLKYSEDRIEHDMERLEDEIEIVKKEEEEYNDRQI